MPVDNRTPRRNRASSLIPIPQFPPPYALGITRRHVCAQIDSPHRHAANGVLVDEGHAGDEARVSDVDGTQVVDVAYVEDDGAGGEVGELRGAEVPGEEAVGDVAVHEGFFVEGG